MCLVEGKYLSKEKAILAFKNLKIAKKDIIVWKTLVYDGKDYFSPYLNFKYKKGMHYYQKGKKFTYNIEKNYYSKYLLCIYKGLHSYTKKTLYSFPFKIVVSKKMIIPKGSKYYLSYDGEEIVSDNLIFPYDED